MLSYPNDEAFAGWYFRHGECRQPLTISQRLLCLCGEGGLKLAHSSVLKQANFLGPEVFVLYELHKHTHIPAVVLVTQPLVRWLYVEVLLSSIQFTSLCVCDLCLLSDVILNSIATVLINHVCCLNILPTSDSSPVNIIQYCTLQFNTILQLLHKTFYTIL